MAKTITLIIYFISCFVLVTQGFLFPRFFKKLLRNRRRKVFPELSLVRLDPIKYPNAKCLDGSFGAYYISRPYKIINGYKIRYTSKIWAFYLEGGGLCFDNTTCTSVPVRLFFNLTSSTTFTPTFNSEGYGWISRNCQENPDFCKANLVYVPYCSQDTFNGERMEPVTFTAPFTFNENPNGDWYFSGKFIIRAIIDDIKRTTNIEKADAVLIGGTSAGAYGTWTNVDEIQESLPTTTVKGLSSSGWIIPGDYNNGVRVSPVYQDVLSFADPSITQNLFISFEYLATLYNAIGSLPPNCLPLFGLQCGSADAFAGFIKAPVFWTEYNIDASHSAQFSGAYPWDPFSAVPILTDFQKAFAFYYAGNLLQSLAQLNTSKDGYYVANCFDHVDRLRPGESLTVDVNGTTLTQAFGDWFFERKAAPFVIIDDCVGVNCNSDCRFPPQ